MWADNAPHGSKRRGVLTSCKCDGSLKCRERHGMKGVCSQAHTTLFSTCQLRDHMPLAAGLTCMAALMSQELLRIQYRWFPSVAQGPR
jgi:hypothetical protein